MKRRLLLRLAVLLTIAGFVISVAMQRSEEDILASTKPNVLFIAVDDLNHWVRHLGRNQQVMTPNIDRLAKMGVTFTNAYCAAPICI